MASATEAMRAMRAACIRGENREETESLTPETEILEEAVERDIESKIGRSAKESSEPGLYEANGKARCQRVDRTWELGEKSRGWFRRQRALLNSHHDVVSGGYSLDGTCLLTSSWNGMACLQTADGAERTRFIGHEGAVLGGSLSPDGTYVLTFSRGQTARLWSVDGRAIAVLRSQLPGLQPEWLLSSA